MSRPAPAIVARLTAEQLATIAGAADFGHCLECAAPIPFALAIDGQALCCPCDREAAAIEAELEALAGDLLPRICAELAGPEGYWSLGDTGRWTLQPGALGQQLALAL
jgi:hypothetical protein